jgi:hypothetical protein
MIGLLALAIAGCATVDTSGPPADVAGTWKGSAKYGFGGPVPVELSLRQTGQKLEGEFSAGFRGCVGAVEGAVAGAQVRVQRSMCTVTLSVEADEMIGGFEDPQAGTVALRLRRSR